ncbi:mitochondrial carrier [Suillus paluster]|uniref:mitochondrial carrier n=1 Tax=Suillus paluster TaxID=48578 RepID=UPI001B869260|nr:mitochondrial carrier [Suillus paluster]KAG1740232.1 mitochondrial carrier [Suillus paluster]
MMGGTAAAISKTTATLIERVGLLIQNQGAMIASRRLDRLYKGITDCFKRTISEEGAISCALTVWRGNATNALNFAFKMPSRRVLVEKSHGFGLWVSVCTAASASSCIHSISTARTRLAADGRSSRKGGQRQVSGLIDVYMQTLCSDGIVGLYRGFVPGIFSVCVYRGLYFGGDDTIRDTFLVGDLRGDFMTSFFVGWMCTTGAAMIAYPLNIIRRRMMMTSGEKMGQHPKYDNAGKQIVANEGVRTLFDGAGAGANILRSVAVAGVLSSYDKYRWLVCLGKVY